MCRVCQYLLCKCVNSLYLCTSDAKINTVLTGELAVKCDMFVIVKHISVKLIMTHWYDY